MLSKLSRIKIAGLNVFGITITVSILVLLFLPLPTTSLWLQEVLNSGHSLLFFVLSFYLFHVIQTKTTAPNIYPIFFLVVFTGVLLAASIEVVQIFLQRDASLNDLLADVIGMFTGLCLIASSRMREAGKYVFMSLYAMSALILTLLVLLPLMQLSWHYIERDNAFPVIIDLGAKWSTSFIKYNSSELLDSNNLKEKDEFHPVQFGLVRYPGISVIEPVSDWSNFHRLRFSVMSDNKEDMELILRVHDKAHDQNFSDRFNQALIVRPGINEYSIAMDRVREGPSVRSLDLTEIMGIILFLTNVNAPVQLSMGYLYLE